VPVNFFFRTVDCKVEKELLFAVSVVTFRLARSWTALCATSYDADGCVFR